STASWCGSTTRTAWFTCASSAPTPNTIASTRSASDGALLMDIKPIRTKRDYRAALKEIESLMVAKAGTPAGERLDILATLVEAYEKQHFPMELPDAVEAI